MWYMLYEMTWRNALNNLLPKSICITILYRNTKTFPFFILSHYTFIFSGPGRLGQTNKEKNKEHKMKNATLDFLLWFL